MSELWYTIYLKFDIINTTKGKGYKIMYELIINGRTIYTTTNKADITMKGLWDFYKANKVIMNITDIMIVNVEERFVFEG